MEGIYRRLRTSSLTVFELYPYAGRRRCRPTMQMGEPRCTEVFSKWSITIGGHLSPNSMVRFVK